MRYPQPLQSGDAVAVVSPSWGGPHVFPGIYELGLEVLREDFELEVREFPTARMSPQELFQNPEKRADDISEAFRDPEIKAVIASIGGEDSMRLLPYVDWEAVESNPTILLGYSDTSTLLTHANRLGLVTFHGPCVMAGFAQMREYPEWEKHARRMLFQEPRGVELEPFSEFSHGYPDWSDKEALGQVKRRQPNERGWQWLQGEGRRRGRLWGGCLDVLEFLKGTRFWPSPGFWAGRVLFFETSEEAPPPAQVKRWLRNYGLQGALQSASALLFGRPRGYSGEDIESLEKGIVAAVRDELGCRDLPIVANLDFGHTDPQLILPLGAEVEIDCDEETIRIT